MFWAIVERRNSIFAPSTMRRVTRWSSSEATVPKMPDWVTTWSPTFSDFCISWVFFICFCCGRIRKSQKTANIRTSGKTGEFVKDSIETSAKKGKNANWRNIA